MAKRPLTKRADGAGHMTHETHRVFSARCPEIERMVRFLDHLRTDDEDRLLYERTKRTPVEVVDGLDRDEGGSRPGQPP